MRVITTVILHPSDLGLLNDNLIERDLQAGKQPRDYTDADAQALWDELPDSIQEKAIQWGLNDTVVSNCILDWLLRREEKKSFSKE